MKTKLNSSARLNRRYLLFEGNEEEIKNSILEYVGVLGFAKSSPVFMNFKDKKILAVNRKELNNILASFSVSKFNIKVLKISGTLKGLTKK